MRDRPENAAESSAIAALLKELNLIAEAEPGGWVRDWGNGVVSIDLNNVDLCRLVRVIIAHENGGSDSSRG